MSLINSTAIPNGASAYEVEQSLRFNNPDNAYLSRTFVTPTNRKIWTFSVWLKRSVFGAYPRIFSTATGAGGNTDNINFMNDDKLRFISDFGQLTTTQVFRDPSAWYHIVYAFDSTQSTEANRLKLYVNGTQVTSFASTAYPTLNDEVDFNSAIVHDIGRNAPEANQNMDGYLGELYWIDGQAKAPTDFGETGTYGEWKPIEYEGTYGNNGFHLPFKQDYTVEGFSAVTYRGNSVAGTYVGGVGFKSDMIWVKSRNNGNVNHVIQDAVRGVAKTMHPNLTVAEASNSRVTGFTPDGFVLSAHGHGNYADDTYVAWNWDMGSKTDTKTITGISGGVTSTSQYKFGTASLSMQGGSNSRHYKIDDHPDWDFSTGDFTIELWIRQASNTSNYDGIISFADSSGTAVGFGIGYNASNKIAFISHLGNVTNVVAHNAALSNNTWHHIAVSRSSGTTKLFINGTQSASATDNNNYITTANGGYGLSLGRYYPNRDEKYFHGEFDEIRISNNARYTGNFSVATSAFTKDDNTKLLMHCDGAHAGAIFKDHSASTPNTSGSIASDVAAHTTYGQSIVSWKGTGANATVGHGLSAAPELVIYKNRNDAGDSGGTNGNWIVQTTGIGADDFLLLNETSEKGNDSGYFRGTRPSSTLLTLGAYNSNNGSNDGLIAYCFHSVSGYSKINAYTGNGSTTGPSVTTGFKVGFLLIKCTNAATGWAIIDKTRTPTNPTRGSLFPDKADAEYTGTEHGVDLNDNGFQIKNSNSRFNTNNKTYIYMAFADKREYAYWLDQSGNNNDWASNNLTESDIMVDSPTNNFCTMNPLTHNSAAAYEQGNLRIETPNYPWSRGTFAVSSGKWYWEWTHHDGSYPTYSGICNDNRVPGGENHGVANNQAWYGNTDGLLKNWNSSGWVNRTDLAIDDIIGIAVDLDNGSIKWYKNNTLVYTDSTLPAGEEITAMVAGTNDGTSGSGWGDITFNFGQDSSFAGFKTAQGNQDSNEIGDFYYTPPTGFLALCSKSLPDVDVIPSENFSTVLWTGNETARSIAVPFAPDFLWLKTRGATYSHYWMDNVRGQGNRLFSNSTNAESNDSSAPTLTSTGFNLTNSTGYNSNNVATVGWNWKANGAGASNTEGSINTTKTSANVDAGFSIISYTGNGSSGATIGHGLSKAPELYIFKRRNTGGSDWIIWQAAMGDPTYVMYFTANEVQREDVQYGGLATYPTASVLTLGSNAHYNANNSTYICYAFHSVEGYSKVGTYKGNNNANGPYVNTGFRPAFVMTKSTGDTDWTIHDSVRDIDNPLFNELTANSAGVEGTSDVDMDFTSNGFKIRRASGQFNANNATVIYLAFAETPFKYSNAR